MKEVMVLRGGRLTLPERTVEGDLLISKGRIVGMAPAGQGTGTEIWDLEGRTVMAGLIDSHFHGAWGVDVSRAEPEQIVALSRPLASHGVTRWLPTILPAPEEELLESVRRAARACEMAPSSVVGIHLEGPFISRDRKGALPELGIYPYDDRLMEKILDAAAGHLRVMTFAPEAIEPSSVKRITSLGVALSVGHTCACATTTRNAIRAGVRRATHLCNAMPGIHHRDPGPMVPLLIDPSVRVELIVDGEHVDDSVIELILRIKGSHRVLAVSDAMPLSGMSAGADTAAATPVVEGEFAGVKVKSDGQRATLEDGTLAGSVTLLWPALRRLQRALGLTLQEVSALGANSPAADLPLSGLGRVQTGAPADLLILEGDRGDSQDADPGNGGEIVVALRGGRRADAEASDADLSSHAAIGLAPAVRIQ